MVRESQTEGNTMAVWEMAGRGRRDFADMIEGLSDEQLNQQSLCDAWTARGVLCHLTAFVETGFPSFVGGLVKNKFDFDKASLAMAQKQLDRPVADVIASLRAKATKSSAMPVFPEELTVTDTAIHTQDVRRPLGLDGSIADDIQLTALNFLTEHKMATMLVNRPPIDGVKLTATDMDWTWGSGAEITGTAEALMMGLAKRPVLDDLSGEGLTHWR